MDKIRIGIIGAGNNTVVMHIPKLMEISGVEIIGVCNRSEESSQRVAEKFKIPKTYNLWTEVVEDSDVDAVVIGTWPYLHCRATVAALEADKHVLCEARMAMNAWEAHEMLEASQRAPQLTAQIVPAPFTLRVDRMIQKLIAEGYLGEILAVEIRAPGGFLDAEAPLHWRQDSDLSGFNIMTLGIWYETMMRWVGEAVRVTAMGKTYVKMRRDASGVMRSARIPEHLDVIADLACGAQAHIMISAAIGHAGKPEAFIFGSKGTLRFSDQKLYGGQKTDSGLAEIQVPKELEGRWRVEEEFIGAIRGKEKVSHTRFEDGVKYMEFTEGVARSLLEQRVITLPL